VRIVVAAVAAVAAGVATPVYAFHRQTPPIVELTSTGDNTGILPRVHPEFFSPLILSIDTHTLDPTGYFRKQLLPSGFGTGGSSVNSIVRQNWFDKRLQELANTGDPANPSASGSGLQVAWDGECTLLCNGQGRQIFSWKLNHVTQITHDASGTSTNPAYDGRGDLLAFQSQGDLIGDNPGGTSQIFTATLNQPTGNAPQITQVTHGAGTSVSPVLDFTGHDLVFQSTNDTDGLDTGIPQIWLGVAGLPPEPITQGAAPSVSPDLSGDGHVVVFQSTADLTGDGHDTGVPQVFAYDTRFRVLRQVTNDPAGCTNPTVHEYKIDWRVAYVCHGTAFLALVNARQHFRVPVPPGADTAQVLDFENNFVVVSTTAYLTGGNPTALTPASGTTEGHQLYLVNLFKLPPIALDAGAPTGIRR
jgi:hypothetical protein